MTTTAAAGVASAAGRLPASGRRRALSAEPQQQQQQQPPHLQPHLRMQHGNGDLQQQQQQPPGAYPAGPGEEDARHTALMLVRYVLAPAALLPLAWPWLLVHLLYVGAAAASMLASLAVDVTIATAELLRANRTALDKWVGLPDCLPC